MEKQDLIDQLNEIEKLIHMSLPSEYKRFMIENVKDTIQAVEPGVLLIGQDGDLGYFLNLRKGTDEIYSLDLGALGSLDMDKESNSIFML